MLKIRLSRVGKRNNAAFRIVVTEHYKPVKAGFIEHIGFYNPQSKKLEIDKLKLESWIKKGATPSTSINNLLVREKIFNKDKLIKITRTPKKKEEEKEEKTEAKDKTKTPEEKTEAKKEEKAEKKIESKTEAKKEEKEPEVDKK